MEPKNEGDFFDKFNFYRHKVLLYVCRIFLFLLPFMFMFMAPSAYYRCPDGTGPTKIGVNAVFVFSWLAIIQVMRFKERFVKTDRYILLIAISLGAAFGLFGGAECIN